MEAHSRQISRSDWKLFFDRFSRQYSGRIVDVEVFGEEVGLHTVVRRLPFIGVTAETPPGATPTIQVTAGRLGEGMVTHVISDPSQVWIKQELDGGDSALEIESGVGPKVLLEFGTPLSPSEQAVE